MRGCIPPQDRCAVEIAEKAGRLEETLLRLGKAHRDRHLHRLKVLTTVCAISAAAALAPLCFALILALLRPVLSTMGGVKDLLPDSSFSGTSALPDRTMPPDSVSARRLSPGFEVAEDTRPARFNEVHGGEIAEFMRKYAPAVRQEPEGPENRKRLGPKPRIKFQFRKPPADSGDRSGK